MRAAWLFWALVPTTVGAAPEQGSRNTREFLQAAASTNAFERLETDLMMTGSRNAGTRAFAQRLASEHAASERALADAATQAGLPTPKPAMSEDQAHLLAALQGLNGPDLDQAYARQQVLAHSSALAVMQRYAAEGEVPALRRFANAAVPAVTADLQGAQQLMGGASAP
jgi:putative membrane protein